MTVPRDRLENADEFDRMTDSLAWDLTLASAHYQLYKDLRQGFEHHESGFNSAPVFWSWTLRAHIQQALTSLARVYDQQRNALSLRRWLELIEANWDLLKARCFAEPVHSTPFELSTGEASRIPDLQRLKHDIYYATNRNRFVKKLTLFRNNLLGHRSLAHSRRGTDLLEAFPLGFGEVEELLEGAFEVFNIYSEVFRQKFYSREAVGRDDLRVILQSVRQQRDDRDGPVP